MFNVKIRIYRPLICFLMNGGDGFSILIIVWQLCKIVKVVKKLKKKISFGRVKLTNIHSSESFK